MRDIVKMFSDAHTFDDLGVGQVRDGLSTCCFPALRRSTRPATSWLSREIFQRTPSKHTGILVTSKANDEERKLIEVLRSPTRGMIGSRAGKTVQNVLSNVHSASLHRYKSLVNVEAPR